MIKLANPGTLRYPITSGKKNAQIFSETNIQLFNTSGFEYNGSITAKVIIDGVQSGSENDLLLAYVDNQIRGVVGGLYFNSKDVWLYPLMIHSNFAEGDIVEFRYFDAANQRYYSCNESIVFKQDMIVANALKPFELNIKTINRIENNNDDTGLKIYPNPFEHFLNIEYDISCQTNVRLTIFNSIGEPVRQLVNQVQEPDHYTIQWDSHLQSSGIYIIKLEVGAKQTIQKVTLIR
jgi:hypothetical protein